MKRKNKEFDTEIIIYAKLKSWYRLTHEMYQKIIKFSSENHSIVSKKYISTAISKISGYLKQCDSNNLLYYLMYIKVKQYSLTFQYKKSLECLEELRDHLIKSKNIYSRQKHGSILLNMGLLSRYLFNIDSSIQYLNESKRYLHDNDLNNSIFYEQMFLSHFYNGNVSKMKYYLLIIQKECIKEKFKYLNIDKFNYYMAVFYTIDGNPIITNGFVNSIIYNIEYSSINIEYRILLIMNNIECGKLDLADSNIENLRKYFSRSKLETRVRERKNLILKLLNKLSQAGYNFKKTLQEHSVILNTLRSMESFIKISDFEMILFHEWFEAKAKGIPYNHFEVMKRLKRSNVRSVK